MKQGNFAAFLHLTSFLLSTRFTSFLSRKAGLAVGKCHDSTAAQAA